nr:RecName: Full=Mytimycin [Mytilus edulis]
DCCRKPFRKHCWDCTAGTPYYGYSTRNIFGCTC